MRRILQVTAAVTAMLIGTAAHTPTATAGVDDCTYAAWQFCQGIVGPDGQYLHPGAEGWLACVAEAKQYMIECEPRPSNGPTGNWCYFGYGGDVRWRPC